LCRHYGMPQKVWNYQDCPKFDKPTRRVTCAVIKACYATLVLFLSKCVYVSLECVCFQILCYRLNIPLCLMCHQISRDGAISYLYIELQRYDKNDEIWRLYRSNYILIISFFLWTLCEALNCLNIDFSFLSNIRENSIHTSS
jgi:hypothetical protein